MKKRVFSEMDNMVYRVVVDTEDWSQGDIELMDQFGEPEVNVGGSVKYMFRGEQREMDIGDQYVRLLHGFPYARGFDARDYIGPVDESSSSDSSGSSCSSDSSGGDSACDDYSSRVEEAVAVGKAWKEIVLGRIDEAVIKMRSLKMPLPTEEVSEI